MFYKAHLIFNSLGEKEEIVWYLTHLICNFVCNNVNILYVCMCNLTIFRIVLMESWI